MYVIHRTTYKGNDFLPKTYDRFNESTAFYCNWQDVVKLWDNTDAWTTFFSVPSQLVSSLLETPPPLPTLTPPFPPAASNNVATISFGTVISSQSCSVRVSARSRLDWYVPFQSNLLSRLFAAFFRWPSSVGFKPFRIASAIILLAILLSGYLPEGSG